LIISLIVATDDKGGIGKDNRLPWHLHSDLKRFKTLTMGHHLVMGRKTFETIGKLLPGRIMVVVTRNTAYHPKGCIVVNSLEAAVNIAKNNQETELFVIGGGDIFNQAIDIADKVYLTTVHAVVNADVFFPTLDPSKWKLIWNERIAFGGQDDFESDFKILLRNN